MYLIRSFFRNVFAYSAFLFEGVIKVIIIKPVHQPLKVVCQVFYKTDYGYNVQKSLGKVVENSKLEVPEDR